MSKALEHFTQRIRNNDFFLAPALWTLAQSEGLDEAALAKRLGCHIETLKQLQLCRRPKSDQERFQQEVERIAVRFDLDSLVLVETIRRFEVLTALRQENRRDVRGLLMAARDKEGD